MSPSKPAPFARSLAVLVGIDDYERLPRLRSAVFDVDALASDAPLYVERYQRYVRHPARQLLASAAYDERALDVVAERPIGVRPGSEAEHSPFAAALLAALTGDADLNGDGVILARELE